MMTSSSAQNVPGREGLTLMNKIKALLATLQEIWSMAQDLISIKGGLYVDAFALVILVRLLAVLKGAAPLNPSEAGLWAVTIAAFSYSHGGPNGQA